jgi:hypothetical protein
LYPKSRRESSQPDPLNTRIAPRPVESPLCGQPLGFLKVAVSGPPSAQLKSQALLAGAPDSALRLCRRLDTQISRAQAIMLRAGLERTCATTIWSEANSALNLGRRTQDSCQWFARGLPEHDGPCHHVARRPVSDGVRITRRASLKMAKVPCDRLRLVHSGSIAYR